MVLRTRVPEFRICPGASFVVLELGLWANVVMTLAKLGCAASRSRLGNAAVAGVCCPLRMTDALRCFRARRANGW